MNETTERASKRLESCVGLTLSLGMRREIQQGTVKTDVKQRVLYRATVHVSGESVDFCGVRGEKQRKTHAIILHRGYNPANG